MDASHQPQKLTRAQTSRWGRRKSIKEQAPEGAHSFSSQHGPDKGKEREHSEQQDQVNHSPSTWAPVPSIVPDPLLELPAWYHSDVFEWSAATAVQFRRKYPLHNPVGPRWYKNNHLLPPSVIRGNRAPSVFSPSFPPISVSGHDRPEHTMSLPVPVRTPSSSPSPSPNTSQVQINESAPARTRKVSHTGPGADSLDASDPSGINFHHSSPYDIGFNRDRHVHSPESPEVCPLRFSYLHVLTIASHRPPTTPALAVPVLCKLNVTKRLLHHRSLNPPPRYIFKPTRTASACLAS
jgi:hypothetical protein